jgi:predicted nucleic acid-binding protein
MIVLDTDTLSLVLKVHPRVSQRMRAAPELSVISIVTRIEVLQGRFDSVLKAADADALLRAQQRLGKAEEDLAGYTIVPFDPAAGNEFERLRQNKKLKKIGRNDLLIACIALANQATLITRNVKDFQLVPGLRLENWAD